MPGDAWKVDPPGAQAGHAVREYLATLDDAAFGAPARSPKFISPSDPAAQWTCAHKGHVFFAYAIRQAEVRASRTMLDRTAQHFGLKPRSVAADSAYGSGENLAFLVKQRGIASCIPVFDKSGRTDGTFSRSDIAFNAKLDRYTCPAGKHLVQFHRTYATPRSGITKEGTRLYRTSKRSGR